MFTNFYFANAKNQNNEFLNLDKSVQTTFCWVYRCVNFSLVSSLPSPGQKKFFVNSELSRDVAAISPEFCENDVFSWYSEGIVLLTLDFINPKVTLFKSNLVNVRENTM